MIVVSIITPLYNSISYIEETINSVLNQTFINWQEIKVDYYYSSRDFSYN